MLLGVTLYEPVFTKDSTDRLLDDLGIAALEMSPHERLFSMASARELMDRRSTPTAITLHLPYHHEPTWQADAFDPSVRSTTEPLIRWLEEAATLAKDREHPIPLTLHGASSAGEAATTYRMLDWFSNTIERRHLFLRPSLENLYGEEQQPFGSIDQIKRALDAFSPLLGWTWDLTHDFRRAGQYRAPDEDMLAALTHVHLHGFDQMRDHLFIGSKDAFYTPYLALLEERRISLPLILEVLVEANYHNRIRRDLKSLQFRHEKTR